MGVNIIISYINHPSDLLKTHFSRVGILTDIFIFKITFFIFWYSSYILKKGKWLRWRSSLSTKRIRKLCPVEFCKTNHVQWNIITKLPEDSLIVSWSFLPWNTYNLASLKNIPYRLRKQIHRYKVIDVQSWER